MAPLRRRETLLPLLLLLAAAGTLYVPLDRAAEFRITPDSIEQAAGAWRLARGESFVVRPDEIGLPPRYPPFFAWLAVPGFLISGHPGVAILPVTILAVAAVFLTMRIARSIGGLEAGLAAAAGLLLLPMFRFWATEVMTDVPACAAMLFAVSRLLRLADPEFEERDCGPLACGLVMAAAFLLRPAFAVLGLGAAVLLVWRLGLRRALPRLLWMAAPALVAGSALLLWSFGAYGSFARNGYQFWVSELYDEPDRLFPAGAVGRNLGNLFDTHWPLLFGAGVVLVVLGRIRRGAATERGFRRAVLLLVLTTTVALPYLALHLRYYSGRPRYFLPLFPPLIALVAGLGVPLLGRLRRFVGPIAVAGALILMLGIRWQQPEHPRTGRYAAARAVASRTPKGALIISSLPPDYLRLVTGSEDDRDYLIVSRDEEYASKAVTLEYDGILVSRPSVATTADETTETIFAAVAAGRPVYLLRTELWRARSRAFVEHLEEDLVLEPVTDQLARVLPR